MAWFWNDFFLSNSGDLVKNSQFIIGHIGDQAQIIGGNGNDELSNLIAIERVDSRDVVFDNRPKKTKILGKYVMGDVLGEWKILVHCNNWSNYPEMVFCFQNCSDPFWEKKYSRKLLKFEADCRGLAKISRSQEQFIQTVKGQNNFWNLFLEVSQI